MEIILAYRKLLLNMTHQIVSLFEQGNRSMANSYYHKVRDQLSDEQKKLVARHRY